MQNVSLLVKELTARKSTMMMLCTSLVKIFLLCFVAAMVTAPQTALSQAGQLDPSFNAGDHGNTFVEGANNDVRTIAIQPDGKMILGGVFTSFNGSIANHIVRINTDGSTDAGFNTGGAGADGNVYKVLLQPDGKIILAGKFSNYNAVAASNIIRLNNDGSRDAAFNVGTGFNDSVNVIRLQADSKILVGGNFTTYKGVTANYLVRLNANGSLDGLFTPIGIGSTVHDIAFQADAKVVVGMQSSGFLTRLTASGATDPAFNIASSGINGLVKSVCIQPDGKILLSRIHYVPDFYSTNLARLNNDGSLDAGFNSPTYYSNTGNFISINTIILQTDGKVLLAFGEYQERFTELEGKKINRLNTNGSADATFNYTFDTDFLNQNVYALAIQADGKIVSGESTKWQLSYRSVTGPAYAGVKDFKIKRYETNGAEDENFLVNTSATGSSRQIYATALQADGKILIGGNFYTFNGSLANHLVRLNTDGSKDQTFNIGSGFNFPVYAIAVQPDSKIVVGGFFTTFKGQVCNHIIRLNADGSKDPSFSYDAGTWTWITSLTLQPDGKILAGSAQTGGIIRLNSDGTKDNGFASILQGIMYDIPYANSMAVQSDGKIIIGGHFLRLTGAPSYSGIVRVKSDGTRDTSFNGRILDSTGSVNGLISADGDVNAVAIQPDGKIIAGGTFTGFKTWNTSTTVNRLMRLTTAGVIDPTFNPSGTGANGTVSSVTLLPDGKILAGGNFTSYNGTSVGRLIRINADGSLDGTFNTGGAGANAGVSSITIEAGAARFYIAGDFTSYNGNGKNRITRIFNTPAGAAAVPTTTTVTICANEAPYLWNGNNYSSTGVYTNSVIHPNGTTVDTLILTVGAGNIAGPIRACQYITAGTNAVYQITAPAGSAITWSVSNSSTMSIVSGQGTSQSAVSFQNTFVAGSVSAHIVNATCGINVTRALTVSKALPAAPGGITAGNGSICAVLGTPNTITYSISKVPAASSYIWSAQAGTTTITHTNGAGVNDTTVTVSFSSGFTNSAISVQAVNDCGGGSVRSLNLTRSTPAMPAMINGPAYVCDYVLPLATIAAAYSVPTAAGVSYNWSVPAGATSFSGQGTNSISFFFPAGFTSGSVSVTASNGCGAGVARSMTVKASVAGTPGAITTTNISDCPNRVYNYSIAALPVNATSVAWTLPAGGTIISGQGTTSIAVSYASGLINGYVSVKATNTCGTSTVRKIAVNLTACLPSSPFAKGTNAVPSPAQVSKNNLTEYSLVEGMNIHVFPNPSVNEFNLQVITSGKEIVYVRLFDVAGRFISEQTMTTTETINIGAALKTGTYIVEVKQGDNIKTTRIIKF